jgi:outer membrane protein assembly factor BamB/pSer/pThr/pTyr-binding forkhead associated (FHA) protein
MAIIEITHPSGKSEKKKISRRQPFSIGSHSANNFSIDDDTLASIHCRISWNKTNYEVTSATDQPIKVNGSNVKHTLLRDEDIIHIGEYEFKFRRGKPKKKTSSDSNKDEKSPVKSSTVGLKPLAEDEDLLVRKEPDDKKEIKKLIKSYKKEEPAELTGELLSDILDEEEKENKKRKSSGEDEFPDEVMLSRSSSSGDKKLKKKSSNEETLLEGIQSRIQTRPVRPGEQEMLRSPLILSLGIGTVALALAGLTFWFIIGRNTSDAHFSKASNFRTEKKYTQSVESFRSFIIDFSSDSRVNLAKLELGKCLIEKEINGSIPNWDKGVIALKEFMKNNRDLPEYGSQAEELQKFAEKIAFGAAETSARLKDPIYLDHSNAARKIVASFIKDKSLKAEFFLKLEKEHKKAKAAILKKGVFNKYFDKMANDLKKKETIAAIHTWEGLIKRYPDFRNNNKIKKVKQDILKTEITAVTRDETRKPAEVKEKTSTLSAPISLAVHRRSRTGARSVNRIVVSLAKDCCVGIDTVTGKPIWRKIIGMDTPFFPISADSSGTRILMFDTRSNELINVERLSGQLIWRQSINSSVPGEPLLHEGQIYLSTNNNKLFQIDIETGEILSVINFNQGIHGPPVLDATKEKMILAGDSSFIYTLSIRPLNCLSVSYTGQKSGTIKTPLLRMGSLILVIENSSPNQSLLRVFDTKNKETLVQIDSGQIPGEVINRPVLRGSKLFITSTGQRITAYNVSDDPNQKQLVKLSDFEVRGKNVGSLHLIAGSDNRFWMASDGLREFRLKSDTIQVDEKRVTVGLNTQPIQVMGESFYIGRRPFYSLATLFTEVDRESMTEKWQLTLGASIIKQVSSNKGALLCATENGDFYNLTESAFAKTGYRINTTTQLKIPRELKKSLQITVLKSKKVVVYTDKPSPHIWLLTSTGQIEKEAGLASGIQAPPIEFGKGILLPIAGRIRLWNTNNVKDYIAVFNQKKEVTWKSITSVNQSQFIALDSENNLHRVNLQASPSLNLQKTSQITLEKGVDLPLKSHEASLFLVNSSNELIRLNNSSLEKLETHPLTGTRTLHFWKIGNRLLLETMSDKSHVLEAWSFTDGLKLEWKSDLPEGQLAGKPLLYQKSLILAHSNGTISRLTLNNHQTNIIGNIQQPITCSPALINEKIIVSSIDGSLYVVNNFLSQKNKD